MKIYHVDGDQLVIYCGSRTVPVRVIGTDGEEVEVDYELGPIAQDKARVGWQAARAKEQRR